MKTMFYIDTLALDVGDRRVGIAFGNAKEKIVYSQKSYERAQKRAEDFILQELAKGEIKQLVVGMPKDEKNSETQQVMSINQFIKRIEKRHAIKVVYVDEWGSSLEAKHRLKLPDRPDKKLRESGVIDAEAASIILESYFAQSGD